MLHGSWPTLRIPLPVVRGQELVLVEMSIGGACHAYAAQSRASRSFVYETIHEEYSSPAPSHGSKKSSSPTACQGVFVVPPDSGSMDFTPGASMGWDDERGIDVLYKDYPLPSRALPYPARQLNKHSRKLPIRPTRSPCPRHNVENSP
ncbi:hypothetical protein C8F01DRAFT_698384 [Mycena amicta]|nr:hypothetical protein C8F01DRAFT_376933 [Mycena amicta]KAJ7066350.1 hypothetical protein C8F01DRAFT_698384 [Mycena amicta]